MTEEQKAYQQTKNENDFKTEVVLRFQKLENFIQAMQKDVEYVNALHQEHQVDSIHVAHEISDNCMSSLKELRLVMDDIQKQNKILSDQYNSILSFISSNYLSRSDYAKDRMAEQDRVAKLKMDIGVHRNEFQAALSLYRHELDAKLADFLQKQASKADPIPELRQIFEERIELVSLNGQNSVLRSTNNEKHIHLVEKKIENIYQLIKQIQLDKQA